MRVLVIALLAAVIRSSAALKEASALCFFETESEILHMNFTLKVTGEPVGSLVPLDYRDYYATDRKYTDLGGCEQDLFGNVYSIESTIYPNRIENGCGMERIFYPQTRTEDFVWLFLHQNIADDEFIGDDDDIYLVRCNQSVTVVDVVRTNLTVNAPGLEKEVRPLGLDVTYQFLVFDGANYVSASTASAGTKVKLLLTLNREDNFDMSIHTFGVYGHSTYLGPDGEFTANKQNDLLIDKYGCPYDGTHSDRVNSNERALPYPATGGYTGWWSADGRYSYSETGWFFLQKYDGSDYVHAQTYFKPFMEPQKDIFANPCDYFSALRRKRSSGEGDKDGQMYAKIKVTIDDGDSRTTADAAADRQVAIIAGAVSGAALVMIIAGIVCLVAIIGGKRRRAESAEASRSSSTVSIVPKKI